MLTFALIHIFLMEHMHEANDRIHEMELLYAKYYHRLFLYALTLLGEEEEARDVVAEVFQMVWEDWTSGARRFSAPTASFLYTSARNRCLDVLRHAKATSRYAEMVQATQPFATDGEVEAFERRVAQMHEAVNRLPQTSRQVLMQIYYNRLTYKQAAEQLGMSENMVHKHMVKVFRLLRESVGRVDSCVLLFVISAMHQSFQ